MDHDIVIRNAEARVQTAEAEFAAARTALLQAQGSKHEANPGVCAACGQVPLLCGGNHCTARPASDWNTCCGCSEGRHGTDVGDVHFDWWTQCVADTHRALGLDYDIGCDCENHARCCTCSHCAEIARRFAAMTGPRSKAA